MLFVGLIKMRNSGAVAHIQDSNFNSLGSWPTVADPVLTFTLLIPELGDI